MQKQFLQGLKDGISSKYLDQVGNYQIKAEMKIDQSILHTGDQELLFKWMWEDLMTKKDGHVINDRKEATDNAVETIVGINEELISKLDKGSINIKGLTGDLDWPLPKPDLKKIATTQKKHEDLLKWTDEDHKKWLAKTEKVSKAYKERLEARKEK